MKLRQSLLLSGGGAVAMCLVLSAMLIFSIGQMNSARELQGKVRQVEDELDAVTAELLAIGLSDSPGDHSSRLVQATERASHAMRANEELLSELGEDFGDLDRIVLRYAAALGHGEESSPVAQEGALELREALVRELGRRWQRANTLLVDADDQMDAAQDRVILMSFSLLGLVVLMIAVMTTRVVRRVLRPTRDLKAAMEQLDHGAWPLEVEVAVDDELGELAATFNSMVLGKRETEQQLHTMHEELEERVVLRTEALARANFALEQEIEERKRAEGLLRASEERFRRIFEEGPIGIALVAKDALFLTVNHALARILGSSAEEIEGTRLGEHCATEECLAQCEGALAVFRSGARTFSGETRIRRPDGELRRITLVATSVPGQRGGADYGLLMVEDVTERKRTEELLLENERFVATGRMAARIAHEINNPLAGIKNAFRLVKGAVPTDHEFYKYVPRIDREIDRVALIVRQMYELYRPPSESRGEFRADEAIADVVALMSAGERAEGVSRILLDVSDARVRVNLVEGLLRQVLYNLIQNAVEHSPRGTPVRVTARAREDELEILVVDEGEGIAPETGGRIFEAFFTTKEGRRSSGLGLGLSITLRAVEAMGGTLTFDSELGTGTTFRVRLPLQVQEAVTQPAEFA